MQDEIPRTHIWELPEEILENVFTYLTAAERRVASETCSSWFFLANVSRFTEGQYVTLRHKDFEENPPPIFIYKYSRFCQQNYQFKDLDIKYLNEFGDDLGQRIKSLVLRDKCSNKTKNIELLKKIPNVQVLRINFNCQIEVGKSIAESRLEFPYLRTLDFTSCDTISDALIEVLTCHAPALEEIIFTFCFMLQDKPPAIADGGLCDTSPIHISTSRFTHSYFYTFLTRRASNIKHLNLNNALDCKKYVDVSFSKIKNLRLLSLDISCNNYFGHVTDSIILDVVSYQFHLKKLYLNYTSSITDKSLEYIATNLINLEYLSLSSSNNVTDFGIMQLQNLKKLKSLNVSGCREITGDSFINGICRDTNLILVELDIAALNRMNENDLIKILQKLPNLRFLNISHLREELTDRVLQTIIEHQTRLKILKLRSFHPYYYLITDAGFTGVNFSNSVENMKENNVLSSRLKQLKFLDLSGLIRITDRTLQYAIISTKLQRLDLSYCQSITPDGFKYLCKNCPNLEELDLSYCNITDSLIIELATNLKGLRTLHIHGNGFSPVTDEADEAIKKIRRIICRR